MGRFTFMIMFVVKARRPNGTIGNRHGKINARFINGNRSSTGGQLFSGVDEAAAKRT
jgi:hypothetical protein